MAPEIFGVGETLRTELAFVNHLEEMKWDGGLVVVVVVPYHLLDW